MIDSQYTPINCSLEIKQENNQIICLTKGKKSSQIFQTMGLDSQSKSNILLKIKNYLNYNLNECKIPTPEKSSSSTLTIVIVVCSIVVALIIAFVIFLIIRKKKLSSNKDSNVDSLVNKVDELQES